MSEELKPCPFCGGEPFVDAVDRLIRIGCKPCGYNRHWRGLLMTEKTKVKVNDSEYYNQFAQEEANADWNRRVLDQ